MIRGVISFKDAMGCIPEGFKAMVAPILILTLAWTLKSTTDSLGIAEFVAGITEHFAGSLMSMLPAIIFVIGCILAFASGTSWGTFGILNSNRCRSIPEQRSSAYDRIDFSLYGRRCSW